MLNYYLIRIPKYVKLKLMNDDKKSHDTAVSVAEC